VDRIRTLCREEVRGRGATNSLNHRVEEKATKCVQESGLAIAY
jgi:hypothetical protein